MNLAVSLVFFMWLALLTGAVVLIVRQLAAIDILNRQRGEEFSFTNDGLAIGAEAPAAVSRIMRNRPSPAPAFFVILSSTCGPCRQLIADLDGSSADLRTRTVWLVVGVGEPMREVSALAGALSDQVIAGKRASEVAAELDVHSSPFVVLADADRILAKRYLPNAEALLAALSEWKQIESTTSERDRNVAHT